MWRPQQVSREEREEAQSSRRRHSVSESLRTLNASSFLFAVTQMCMNKKWKIEMPALPVNFSWK
jgi:hypothetical protein